MRNSRSVWFRLLLLSCLGLRGAAEPPAEVGAATPWGVTWHPSEALMDLQAELRPRVGAVLHLPSPGSVPGATVEVWGEGPQETLKLFQARLDPELQAAFAKGWDCDTSAQMLCETMAMGWDVHAPTVPAVFYNGFQPALPAQDTAWVRPLVRPHRP